MSARDRRLAREKFAGQKSASQAAKEKEHAKATRRNGGNPPPSRDEQMRSLIARQRDQASKERGRAAKRNVRDRGEAFVDSDHSARSITGWFRGRG